jgi:hypothetical protein
MIKVIVSMDKTEFENETAALIKDRWLIKWETFRMTPLPNGGNEFVVVAQKILHKYQSTNDENMDNNL